MEEEREDEGSHKPKEQMEGALKNWHNNGGLEPDEGRGLQDVGQASSDETCIQQQGRNSSIQGIEVLDVENEENRTNNKIGNAGREDAIDIDKKEDSETASDNNEAPIMWRGNILTAYII